MYNLTKEDFRDTLKTLELQIKKEEGHFFGLWSIATELTNYYFTNFYPFSRNHTLEDDKYVLKLAKIVNIDLVSWLSKNYHYLLEPTEENKESDDGFNFAKSIEQAKRFLKV